MDRRGVMLDTQRKRRLEWREGPDEQRALLRPVAARAAGVASLRAAARLWAFAGLWASASVWAATGPALAAAQTSPSGLPATLEQSVERAFTRMERVMAPCIARQSGRQQIDVRFIGVTNGDPHIDGSLRNELNARVAAAINRISPFVASPAEVSGLIPGLTPGSPLDLKRLRAALDAQIKAPLVAVLELTRPSVAVISMRLRLLGRNDEGVFGCPQQRVLHVDVANLEPVARPAGDLQVRTFAGFWQVTLSQFAATLGEARKGVQLALDRPYEAACGDLRQVLMTARSGYFAFRRAA
ncbi:MAG: hypothetical protein AAFO79_09980, partial [Pseudomonadota bacterium]